MDIVKLGKRFKNYIPFDDLNGIYKFMWKDSNMSLVIRKLEDPINIIKLVYTIYFLKNNMSAENVSKIVDTELYAFSVLVSKGEISYEDCDYCGGDGRENCEDCDGIGSNTCKDCDGDGQDSEGDTCGNCDGEGTIECGYCGGNGDFNCDNCDGNGILECETSINYRVYDYVSINKNLKEKLTIAKESNVPIDYQLLKSVTNNSIQLYFQDYLDVDKDNKSLDDNDFVTDLKEIMDFELRINGHWSGIITHDLDHREEYFSYLDKE